eukprot:76718-Rhodomonas_salina.1
MSSGSPYVSRADIMTDYLPSLSLENQAQVTLFFADFDGVSCWVPPTLTLCRAIYPRSQHQESTRRRQRRVSLRSHECVGLSPAGPSSRQLLPGTRDQVQGSCWLLKNRETFNHDHDVKRLQLWLDSARAQDAGRTLRLNAESHNHTNLARQ